MHRLSTFPFLLLAVLLLTADIFAAGYPPPIQAALEKEASGENLTDWEKAQVSDYFLKYYALHSPELDSTWGPDAFGYWAADPTSGGEPYSWIDISSSGTEIWRGENRDDVMSSAIPLPWSFTYYGTIYDSIYISANAAVNFTGAHISFTAPPIPHNEGVGRIDPWCCDMYHTTDSHFYYGLYGNDAFVISFIDVRYYDPAHRNDPAYGKDLQIILYRDGRIKFQYRALRSVIPGTPFSSGIEDDAGPSGVGVGNAFSDGYAITFNWEPQYTGIQLANGSVNPLTGNTSAEFPYSVIYRNSDNQPAATAHVYIDGAAHPMNSTGGNYAMGVTYTYLTTLPAGVHNYYFSFVQGAYTARLPGAGRYNGPEVFTPLSGNYDIGGGRDFDNIIDAAEALHRCGVSGYVNFNVYPGLYDGQILIDGTQIPGMGAVNPITIRAIPTGNPVVVTNTSGGSDPSTGNGFLLLAAEYVNIIGFEITNCGYSAIKAANSGNHYSRNCQFICNYIRGGGVERPYWGIHLNNTIDMIIAANEAQSGICGILNYYGERNRIFNNMIYGGEYCGIDAYRGTGNEYYFNSVLMNSDSSIVNQAFNCYYQTNAAVKNNIFYNAGCSPGETAFHLSGSLAAYPVISDYNDLYAPNGGSAGYFNGCRTTLADWRTATGLDAHSISGDPLFLSLAGEPNLHINDALNSPVNAAATPIPAVSSDFDGDPRHHTRPDIGADEFIPSPPPFNVSVRPESQSFGGQAGETVNYHYSITNLGSSDDSFRLTVTGTAWPAAVYNAAGTMVINTTGLLAQFDSQTVMVAHSIPAGTPAGDSDTGILTAISRENRLVSASAGFTSYTAMGGSYDVGGGNMNFNTIVDAVDALNRYGLGAPVTFIVHPGIYDGMVQIQKDSIAGMGFDNPLAFIAQPTAPVIVRNTVGTGLNQGFAFNLIGAQYVTISGFEIDSCDTGGIRIVNSGSDSCRNCVIRNNYIHNIGTGAEGTAVYMFKALECELICNEIGGDYYNIYNYYGRRCKFYNNMTYDSEYIAWRINYGMDNEYHYNSVFHNGSLHLIYPYSNTNTTFKNNIFYSASTRRQNFIIYGGGTVNNLISDYNCIYNPNGINVGYLNGTGYAALSDWQNGTGLDVHSICADPQFLRLTGVPDLHIWPGSQCTGAGVPIQGITEDIDGDPRDPVAPDIGCDECAAPVLTVSLTPLSAPIQVRPGGNFRYRGEVDNNDVNPVVFDVWTEIILPSGAHHGPLILMTNMSIAGGGHLQQTARVNVPIIAPPGEYQYYAAVGAHPDSIIDDDVFTFTVIPLESSGSNLEWRAELCGDEPNPLPQEFSFNGIHPNPFNASAVISFSLPVSSSVRLLVYDVRGREAAVLCEGMMPAGVHNIVFDAGGLASGIYFCRLDAGGFSAIRKMALVK